MGMVFKLRMISDENESFIRDYVIPYDFTLLDFHDFICEDLDYSTTELCSFFKSDSSWHKLQEYTLFDMGDSSSDDMTPIWMNSVTLGNVLQQNNDRLIYVFDLFEDRLMFIELIGTYPEDPNTVYPVIAKSEGEAPDQFNYDPDSSDSIFDEAMDEFGAFEGDDNYDDFE